MKSSVGATALLPSSFVMMMFCVLSCTRSTYSLALVQKHLSRPQNFMVGRTVSQEVWHRSRNVMKYRNNDEEMESYLSLSGAEPEESSDDVNQPGLDDRGDDYENNFHHHSYIAHKGENILHGVLKSNLNSGLFSIEMMLGRLCMISAIFMLSIELFTGQSLPEQIGII